MSEYWFESWLSLPAIQLPRNVFWEVAADGPSAGTPDTHVENQDGNVRILGSWFWPCLLLAPVGILEWLSRWEISVSVALSSSWKYINVFEIIERNEIPNFYRYCFWRLEDFIFLIFSDINNAFNFISSSESHDIYRGEMNLQKSMGLFCTCLCQVIWIAWRNFQCKTV